MAFRGKKWSICIQIIATSDLMRLNKQRTYFDWWKKRVNQKF